MRAERLWRRGLRFPRLFLADRTVLVHGDVDPSPDPRKSRYEARAFDTRSLRPLGTAFEVQGPVNLARAPEGEVWPDTVLVQASRRSVSVRDPRTGSPLLETDLAEPGERWPDDVALCVLNEAKEAVVLLFGESGDPGGDGGGGTRWWAVDPRTGATVPDLTDSRPGHEARGERMSFAGDFLVAPGQDPGFDPVLLADYEHPRERVYRLEDGEYLGEVESHADSETVAALVGGRPLLAVAGRVHSLPDLELVAELGGPRTLVSLVEWGGEAVAVYQEEDARPEGLGSWYLERLRIRYLDRPGQPVVELPGTWPGELEDLVAAPDRVVVLATTEGVYALHAPN
ncbi:hypothetical protein ACWFMI_13700 [Nocardiopsis terrae]